MYDVASSKTPYFPLNLLPNCHSANNSYTMYICSMQCGNLRNLRIPDCVAQWSAVVDLDYYTEQADHYSSSSGQLAIARIYSGGSNCKLKFRVFKLALGYNCLA